MVAGDVVVPRRRGPGKATQARAKAARGEKEIFFEYAPRKVFLPFHNRTQRYACVVAHRRAGKTVAAINDILRAAVTNAGSNPHYAYMAPYRSQAKAVAWGYLKHYAKPILTNVNEAELYVDLMNGGKIRLFGADSADAIRGHGFDGIFMDEVGDFRPSVWGSVIRPTLSDKMGWAVFAGTPKGRNFFWQISEQARRDPKEWYRLELRASSSEILEPDEIASLRAQISQDQYEQEFECSFDAAIVGAIYGVEMRLALEAGRITSVSYDPAQAVNTAWDLGYKDDTAIWFYQMVGREVHVIDYFSVSGASIEEIAGEVGKRPYKYGTHYLPHDARAKTLAAAGRSTVEQLAGFLGFSSLVVVAELSVQDGIQAVRQMLPRCWFDEDKCYSGIESLRQYQREWDEDTKAFRKTPKHDFTSHGSDAFRMLALSWREAPKERIAEPERVLTIGPANEATLNDMWAAHDSRPRRRRI